jgi:hypothetical protein
MELDPKRCQVVKKGVQCGAYPLKGTDRCYAHTKHEQDYPRGFLRKEDGLVALMKNGGRVPLEFYNAGDFFSVPNRITDPQIAKYIGASGIAVFIAICSHVRRFYDDGEKRPPMSFPEIETIASECGCDARHVRRVIERLVKCNILMVVRMWKNKRTKRRTQEPSDLVGKGWEPMSNRYYIKQQDTWCVPN